MPEVNGGMPAGHNLDQLPMSDMDNYFTGLQYHYNLASFKGCKQTVVRCAIPLPLVSVSQSTNMTMLKYDIYRSKRSVVQSQLHECPRDSPE